MDTDEYRSMRDVEDRHWWYRSLRGRVADRVACAAGGRADFSLLDAGCGTGGVLALLKHHFPQAGLNGFDASPLAVQFARERPGLGEVVEGSINDIPFPDASFDQVISLDVLCHRQVEEARAVGEIRRVLKPGGVLIVNLPAFNILFGSHDRAVHTARRYRRPRLRAVLAEQGLQVEYIRYWNSLLFPLILVWRQASRLKFNRGASGPSDVRPVAAPVNALLACIARADRALGALLPMPFGTSVFAVARKPV